MQLYNGTYVVAIAKSLAPVQRECKMDIVVKDREIDVIRNGDFGQRRSLHHSFLIKLSGWQQ